MSVRAKPQGTLSGEGHIRALIAKGGDVKKTSEKLMLVQLRLPCPLVRQIDDKRKLRTVPPSRHAWILEAIMEHL